MWLKFEVHFWHAYFYIWFYTSSTHFSRSGAIFLTGGHALAVTLLSFNTTTPVQKKNIV